MASDAQLVLVERRGAASLLTLNRPKALNALDAATLEALCRAVEEVRQSDAAALVLTGEGRAFAAGADIEAMSKMSRSKRPSFPVWAMRASRPSSPWIFPLLRP